MSIRMTGNLSGLNKADLKKIERLGTRKVAPEEIVSTALAREILELAETYGRMMAVLISREGHVEEVIVGTKSLIYIPDLGRYRFAKTRLRRLRLVFSDLSHAELPSIPSDIYADLEMLRLDMVASLKRATHGTQIAYANVRPDKHSGILHVEDRRAQNLSDLDLDFQEFITTLDGEVAASSELLSSSGLPGSVLVGVYSPRSGIDPERSMLELEELARTAGLNVVEKVIQKREPDPKTILGKGKLTEVSLLCLRHGAEMLVFDTEIKPRQWRVITNTTELKVIDRNMLILDIFAQRANTSDGRLQVELAQLRYNLPRLVEFDAGLSRLTGGIGGRGPGETKLEIGRRRSRERITDLERRLAKLGSQRELKRKRHKASGELLVTIVGYTNAGKSTLFNALTNSAVLAEDKLFATLDTTRRKTQLLPPDERIDIEGDSYVYVPPLNVTFSDSVGFIQDLPRELKSAFMATLEELSEADLLLHVIDSSDPYMEEKIASVKQIIEELGLLDLPVLEVYNKVDLLNSLDHLPKDALSISAASREGFSLLKSRIFELLNSKLWGSEMSHKA